MRQAITTKFHGPTNTKGSRVSAHAEAGSITRHWDYELNPDQNHCRVAKEHAALSEWSGLWIGGAPKGSGYCFVWASPDYPAGDPRETIGTEGRDWFYVAAREA